MPIYEYKCSECGSRLERIEKTSAPATSSCGHEGCSGEMTRQISRSNFKLNGSGWYATDYKTGEKTYKSNEGHTWVQEPVD